jgi:hypothetical protein
MAVSSFGRNNTYFYVARIVDLEVKVHTESRNPSRRRLSYCDVRQDVMGLMDKCTCLSLPMCGNLYTALFNFSEEVLVLATAREGQ